MSEVTQGDMSTVKRALLEVRDLRARLEASENARHEPIAVVGLGCRFPGGADDPDRFWQLLLEGRDLVREVPPDRWSLAELYDPDPERAGKLYSREGGFLDRIDGFDPSFFGIAPRDAVSMDPQHRLLLEVSWEALEHAGIAPPSLVGSRTGVFIGIMTGDYAETEWRSGDLERINAYTVVGNDFSFSAGRISYHFGLQGPSIALDTACSASLVSVHLACQSLRCQESDLALAGGVNLMLTPGFAVSMSRLRALSKDGRSKTFDAAADGYGRGEGCGMAVLKRLSDALADGDPVLAVIRGSAVNHDGPSSGLTVPNGRAQQALIRAALADAGVDPLAVGYVETHGTGTSLGDPIEVNALAAVLGKGRSKSNPLLLGSVKTNIGHLESAAGIAGLIKAVLTLHYGEIPPLLHLKNPNPLIPWAELPVAVPTKRTPWPCDERPRFACLSAFALSGINAHAVLEQAPVRPAVDRAEAPAMLFTLSAKTPTALTEMARLHAEHLATRPGIGLVDRAYTVAHGRGRYSHRLAIAAREPAELQAALAAFATGEVPAAMASGTTAGTPPRIAFLFTGQGSQQIGMGRTLFEQEPVFHQAMERCAAILAPHLEHPLLEVMYPPASAEETAAALLDQTAYTQPALFALEWSLAELWRSWGVMPSFVLGHSVGEYVAATVAGVFTLEEGLELLARRAALMQALPAGGTMTAVFAEPTRVERAVARQPCSLAVAAINAPAEVVISGDTSAVAAAVAELEAEGVRTRPLRVSHAFHSPHVDPILAPLAEAAARVGFGAPRVPLISNLTGNVAEAAALADPGYWSRQAREPVQLARSFETLAAQGTQVFLEIGPQPTLVALGRRCLPDLEASWLPSLRQGQDDLTTLLSSLAGLFVRGLEPAWPALFDRHQPRRVALPAYPFERQRYWADRGAPRPRSQAAEALQASGHPLLGDRFDSPAPQHVFESSISLSRLPYLADHRVFDHLVLPSTAFTELALAAARVAFGAQAPGLSGLTLEEAVEIPAESSLRLQLLLSPAAAGEAVFEVWSKAAAEGEGWHRRAHGTVQLDCRAGELPTVPSLAEMRRRCPRQLASGEVYGLLARQGLTYGPAFRGIDALWLGEGEALVRVARPVGLVDGPYAAHPAQLDACQHASLLLLDPVAGDGGYLPVTFGGLRLLRPLPDQLWSHVRVRPMASSRSAYLASVLLFDDEGTVVAEIRDLELRRVPRRLFDHAAANEAATDLLNLTWRSQASRPRSASAPRLWLVLAEDEPFAGDLAHALTAWGAEVVREPLCRSGEPGFDLAARRQRLGELIGELAAGGQALGLLMVAPATSPVVGLDFGWADLLATAQVLATDGTRTAARLSLLTRGAQPVCGERPLPRGAALGGMARTVAREHPERWGHWIDLAATPGKADLAAAVEELMVEPGGAPLALRQGERLAAVLTPAPASAAGLPWQARPDASYLVTGGLGALGLEVARWLVDRGARHLVLVGRGGAREAATTVLAGLEAAGARLTVLAADVSDAGEVSRVLVACDATGVPLAGVFHAAGVLDDGPLASLDAMRFERVLAAKVLGAELLDRATRDRPLDVFVLFSSIASVLGSAGQAAYATGNALLDALAWARRAEGLPALAINWGPWAGAGMAAALDERAQRRWEERGVRFLAPAHALSLLERALSSPEAQVVGADADWARYQAVQGDGMSSVLLGELGSRPAAAPTASEPETSLLPPAETRSSLAEGIRRATARVLQLPAGQTLDPAQDLHDLGLDSLMTMELRNQLQKIVGQPLPATLLYDHRSLAELARHLTDDVLRLPKPASPDEQSQGLRKLSHQELEELLTEKRRVLAARRGSPQPEVEGP